jgi:hypothetical protein
MRTIFSDLDVKKVSVCFMNHRNFYISSILMFIVYARPIFSEWVFSDEYHLFANNSEAGEHMRGDGALFGEIIYENVSRSLVSAPADLWKLRALSIICLWLVLSGVAKRIYANNPDPFIQFLIPITLLLPAPMTFISWSMMWQASFGILLSYYANQLWLEKSNQLRFISIPVLSLAFLISPNSAFTYFGFFVTILVLSKTETVTILRKLFETLQLFFLAGSLASVSILTSVYFFGLDLNQRVSIVQINELINKITWVVSRPLAASSRFYDISSPEAINAIAVMFLVVGIITLGLIHQSKKSSIDSLLRVSLFFVCSILSITPLVITSSNQIEFRYILGTSLCFFTVCIFFLVEFLQKSKKMKGSVIAILLIVGAVTVNLNVERQFLEPYQSKVQYLNTKITDCIKSTKELRRIDIIPPETPFPVRKNLGMFSQRTDLASPWVPIPSVQSILSSLGHNNIEVSLHADRDLSLLKGCVLDLEDYRTQLVAEM